MTPGRITRQIALLAGSAAIIGMGALTACSPKEKEAPAPTSTPSTSQAPATSAVPPAAPTEKAISGAGPSFSPTVDPVQPGAVCNKIVNGVCSR